MAPPSFSDIGKKFKDLYTKQFPSGFLKCLGKFPTANGLSLSLDGSHRISSAQFTSNIETKAPLKIANIDITWIEKWTVKKELSTNFEANIIKDVTSGVEILYEPLNGQTSLKTKNLYKSDQLTASSDIVFKTFKPEISLSFMTNILQALPLQGGCSITINSNKQNISNMGYGIQLDNGDTCLSASIVNNTDFLTQIYMKLSNLWEIGLETGWNQDLKKTRFCGVSQLKLESGSLLKSKLASCGSFSMGYSFQAVEGIRVTLGIGFNTKNLTSGGQEFGLQIEI